MAVGLTRDASAATRSRSTRGSLRRISSKSLRNSENVSAPSTATAVAVRMLSCDSNAGSPNASPGPSTVKVTRSPNAVLARIAT